jgi:ABC-2 type transport system ATP-binding protein
LPQLRAGYQASLSDPIITASGLTKTFDPSSGVFDIDLSVEPGTIVGLIGPSGSGKTTTVRLMTGILPPESGQIEVLGTNPTEFNSRLRARIGYMPQNLVLYPDLTLRQSIDFAASMYGLPYFRRSKRIGALVDFVELGDAEDRLPAEASGGEQRRAMLAATFVHRPELAFLDEPTAGIDPVLRRKFWDRFEELSDEGRTLVVTTQYVGEAAYCHRVAVLASGRVIAYDTPDGLRRTAHGGELVEVTFERPPTPDDLALLQGTITNRPLKWLDARTARMVVTDAGEAAPAITRWADQRGLEIEKSESYQPPFDDVFIHLIESQVEARPEEVPVG